MKIWIITLLSILLIACTADVLEPAQGCADMNVRYQASDPMVTSVQAIIDQTCSYQGCHDGQGGIGPGDYTRYDGRLLRDLESGSFASRVITQRDNPSIGMPPDASVYPQSRQDSLSTTQLEIITCWLESGFPN